MIAVVPQPQKVLPGQGQFTLKADTAIVYDRQSKAAAQWLAARLAPATGYALTAREGAAGANVIALAVAASPSLSEEGYELSVSPGGISVRGGGRAGVFYACQTIRQLLPPQIESSQKAAGVEWTIPCVKIEDQPRFAWRGCLIDEARHFLGKDVIKRQIDLMAFYKLNRLHWHLTDDQGWRVEIKKYPKLTEVGAWRGANREGGFYTQADIREIVQYAQSRHVLIVPEIEMPGHAQAALAAYPPLGCRGEGYAVGTRWGVYDDVYCPGNDEVLAFLENVLTEVISLFPGPYVHIGADEVPKDRWQKCPKCQARIKANGLKNEHELQGWFVRHFDEFLQKHNRRLIGWDEILDGGLAQTAVVQAWHGMDDGTRAAAGGHDVIMSPTSDCYFDYGYDAIPLPRIYFYDPMPTGLKPERRRHVLGLEGNLWGENIPNTARLDFQGFPRLCALAEVGWSPAEARNWDDFSARMAGQYRRLDVMGVKYNPDAKGLSWGTNAGRWEPGKIAAQFKPLEWDITRLVVRPGQYEATFIYRAGSHAAEIEWAALIENGKEIARDTHKGYSGFDKTDITYRLKLPAVTPQARYVLRASLKGVGGTDSAGDLMILQPEAPGPGK
ncbi:MAG: beta-N-acetylhexosaminidase [Planctomycetota bacterium]|nr:beta-N-acetylhexosaminidase [Planctomycetota bacterium]